MIDLHAGQRFRKNNRKLDIDTSFTELTLLDPTPDEYGNVAVRLHRNTGTNCFAVIVLEHLFQYWQRIIPRPELKPFTTSVYHIRSHPQDEVSIVSTYDDQYSLVLIDIKSADLVWKTDGSHLTAEERAQLFPPDDQDDTEDDADD